MNQSDIRTRILDGLNDSNTAPRFWTLTQINDIIDEAAEVLAEEAGAIRRSAIFSLKPGKQYYYIQEIAQDMMVPYRFWMTNLNRRLVAISMSDLDQTNQRWVDVFGTYPEYWFPVSWNLFGIYPRVATLSEAIRCDYIAWPKALMDDDDEPEFNGTDQDMLVQYGIYDGLLKRWDSEQATAMLPKLASMISRASARAGIWRTDAREFRVSQTTDESYRTGIGRR